MKKRVVQYLMLLFCLIVVAFLNACATVDDPKFPSAKVLEARMDILKKERATYMRLLDQVNSPSDTKEIRSGLDDVQSEYEKTQLMLEEISDIEDGFRNTQKRTVVYGPVGWVLVGSKVLLDKLFIIYPWTWKAF